MSKDKSTPENREFWDSVERAAEEVKAWPPWKRGERTLADVREGAKRASERVAEWPEWKRSIDDMKRRYAHPPVDVLDIQERIAIRFADDDEPPAFTAQRNEGTTAARLFLSAHGRHFSVVLHGCWGADEAMDHLTMLASEYAKEKGLT